MRIRSFFPHSGRTTIHFDSRPASGYNCLDSS